MDILKWLIFPCKDCRFGSSFAWNFSVFLSLYRFWTIHEHSKFGCFLWLFSLLDWYFWLRPADSHLSFPHFQSLFLSPNHTACSKKSAVFTKKFRTQKSPSLPKSTMDFLLCTRLMKRASEPFDPTFPRSAGIPLPAQWECCGLGRDDGSPQRCRS